MYNFYASPCLARLNGKKSYVSMRKNAASALAATVIIDGVVNHCGDEVCKWTCRGKRGREMGPMRLWLTGYNQNGLCWGCSYLQPKYSPLPMHWAVRHMPTIQDSVACGSLQRWFKERPSSSFHWSPPFGTKLSSYIIPNHRWCMDCWVRR